MDVCQARGDLVAKGRLRVKAVQISGLGRSCGVDFIEQTTLATKRSQVGGSGG
jgi:hypothetical protein